MSEAAECNLHPYKCADERSRCRARIRDLETRLERELLNKYLTGNEAMLARHLQERDALLARALPLLKTPERLEWGPSDERCDLIAAIHAVGIEGAE